ncbi:heme lyase NrfEFG subunit NrfF [Entomohabitans teleogrylli]|uniref:heme lyase NrfEFG subunit NrfF n=1 Tax=Entomohabitans teleogrylli TaxID=1384589 RepID=UPI00073D2BB5|nr:heme lyase NrfEFG subunit NrfF [Entomohabitans teleogrylli]
MVKSILLLVALLMAPLACGQVVDTWAFDSREQQQVALGIAGQLRCPQCQNQNLLESNAPVAVSMRHEVFTMVREGKGEAEIMAFMTQRYGDFVRYSPPLNAGTALLWGLPMVMLFAVALTAGLAIRRQRRRGEP